MRALHQELVLFQQITNCFRYVPDNEIEEEILGWNPSHELSLLASELKAEERVFKKNNLYNKPPCIQHFNFIDNFSSPSPFPTWCLKRV